MNRHIRKTTFVLGAGFSKAYRYPLGGELVNHISNFMYGPQPDWFKNRFSERYRNEFSKDLLPFFAGSIDNFLNERPHLKNLGFAVAAKIILDHEDPNPIHLFNNSEYNPYRVILNQLGDLRTIPKDTINVITFNYDRTFEHFFSEHIRSRYTSNFDEIRRIFENINFSHVHGQVGYLPFQVAPLDDGVWTKIAIPYGANNEFTPERIEVATRQMTTVHTPLADPTCFSDRVAIAKWKKALELLHDSRNIFFLGFGYLKENLDKLEMSKIDADGKVILGTSLGVSKDDRGELLNKYGIELKNENSLYTFLVEHPENLQWLYNDPLPLGFQVEI